MVFPSLNIDAELSYIVEVPNLLFLQSEANFWEALETKDIFEDILKGLPCKSITRSWVISRIRNLLTKK